MIVEVDERPQWLVRRAVFDNRQPLPHHEERDFAQFLTDRGHSHFYEPWLYPTLLSTGKIRWFRPDFWLPNSFGIPELHVEFTTTGQSIDPANQRRLQLALNRKRGAIRFLHRYYGIPVVLVHYHHWQKIQDDPQHFDRLVRRTLLSQHRARKISWTSPHAGLSWECFLPDGTIDLSRPNQLLPVAA